MKTSKLLILATGWIGLVAFSAQAQSSVTYTTAVFDVPFANSSHTKPFAINARGDIVGRYFDTSSNPHGFLRHSDGTFAPPINVPVANNGTVVRGLNASGIIVGKYFDAADVNATHGFILTASGAFTSIDVNLSGAVAGTTVANGLNNPGQIIGQYGFSAVVPGCENLGPVTLTEGFLRNTDGTFTDVKFPGTYVISTRAQGIDDAGNIVGTYAVYGYPPNACDLSLEVTTHGFLRDPKGNYSTLDVPASAGALNTLVNGINDAGDVTGTYLTIPLNLEELSGDTLPPAATSNGAFFVLWNNGNFTSFVPDLSSAVGGSPLGINPHGTLTGWYQDSSGDLHGFVAAK